MELDDRRKVDKDSFGVRAAIFEDSSTRSVVYLLSLILHQRIMILDYEDILEREVILPQNDLVSLIRILSGTAAAVIMVSSSCIILHVVLSSSLLVSDAPLVPISSIAVEADDANRSCTAFIEDLTEFSDCLCYACFIVILSHSEARTCLTLCLFLAMRRRRLLSLGIF